MAFSNSLQTFSAPAGADLSASQYRFVTMSAGTVVLAGDGADAIGILQNTPVSGEAAEVGYSGVSKLSADAAFAIDAAIASSADGQGKTATSGNRVLAKAIFQAAGAANQIVPVFVRTQGAPNA